MDSGKPVRGWNATSHEALLLALLDEIKPNKAIITQVTARMTDAGYSYSYDAIKLCYFHRVHLQMLTCLSYSQHIQKLKKSRDATNSNPSTPKKPIKAAGGSRTTSGKKRALKTVKYDDEEDEVLPKDEASDDEDDVSVSPKIKRAKTEV